MSDSESEDNDEDYSTEQVIVLREKAVALKKKASYKFIKRTSEWIEAGYYYSDDDTNEDMVLDEFWLDYLEYLESNRHSKEGMFLSKNFLYTLGSMKEVLFVLALMDLPFASKTDWKIESKTGNQASGQLEANSAIGFSIRAKTRPLMVFYRTLSEYDGSANENIQSDLILRQEILVVDRTKSSIDSFNCVKINPTSQSLKTLVEYGHHFIVINISSRPITCQLTIQIPTGAVPTNNTFYYQSKSITIQPYSTFLDVASTFYFPSSGDFAILPIPALSLEDNQLIGKFDAISIRVVDHVDIISDQIFDKNNAKIQYWTNTAINGTMDSVFSFLRTYGNLDELDLKLLNQRMNDRSFARQTFDILQQRQYYCKDLWVQGLKHKFNDVIQDVIRKSDEIYRQLGAVFESPLITKCDMGPIFDYYPLFNARSHSLRPFIGRNSNMQLERQYGNFLSCLCSRFTPFGDTELVIWATYLVLQDRIDVAHDILSRVKDLNNPNYQVQIDYLRAYLNTRILVTDDSTVSEHIGLQSIKDIAEKYKNYSVARWRQLFSDIYEFACNIEQGNLTFLNNSIDSERIRTEPILEFDIDEQKQEILLKYANISSVEIKYYDMNVEVMFSDNPFIDPKNLKSSYNENISWIKPNYSETIDLPYKMDMDVDDEDFNIIGVGQMNSFQFFRVPINTKSKNTLIEVSSGNIKRHQAYYPNTLSIHLAESYGIVCVVSKTSGRPLSGVYVKVYCQMKNGKETHFWKDGYTGLNGVFDYISATMGNDLIGKQSLKTIMTEQVEKLSILILSTTEGAVVKEVFPPKA